MSTTSLLLIGGLGGSELIIILIIVLLLFGGKKIPELMRGVGKGISGFKKGLNDIEDEINKEPEPTKPADKNSNIKDNTPA